MVGALIALVCFSAFPFDRAQTWLFGFESLNGMMKAQAHNSRDTVPTLVERFLRSQMLAVPLEVGVDAIDGAGARIRRTFSAHIESLGVPPAALGITDADRADRIVFESGTPHAVGSYWDICRDHLPCAAPAFAVLQDPFFTDADHAAHFETPVPKPLPLAPGDFEYAFAVILTEIVPFAKCAISLSKKCVLSAPCSFTAHTHCPLFKSSTSSCLERGIAPCSFVSLMLPIVRSSLARQSQSCRAVAAMLPILAGAPLGFARQSERG
jgi:hypothetical protein